MVATINADTSNGVVITSDTSGEIELQANGVTKAKVTANGLQDANGNSIAGGMYRNRIINGDMRIDARNAGASVATTPIDGIYTLDRWQAVFGVASKFTVQQNAGSVTPPSGFNYYLGITSTSAYTSGSSDYLYMHQKIEGYNVGDLAWGTASAKTVTLSFWVRSSLTGTFGGALANVDNTRNYAFNYTISAANTWEQKTITITGDTSGTWNTTNGVGLRVLFNIGSGSSLLTTAGSWGSTWVSGGTGSTAITGINGATWYVTGVQLEVGSGSSDFEFLPYDVQLARCQRYCWVWDAAQANSNYAKVALGWWNNSTTFRCIIHFPTTMRAAPTSITSTGAFNCFDGTGNVSVSAVGIDEAFTQNLSLTVTTSAATQYRPGFYQAAANQTAKLQVSAEL